MRNRVPNETNEAEELTLQNRLITALLAPLVFNLSVGIAYLTIRATFGMRATRVLNHLSWPLGIMILVPAIAGFLMGTSRFATLLGHCFYTNMGNEKDWRITGMLWAVMLLVAILGSRG